MPLLSLLFIVDLCHILHNGYNVSPSPLVGEGRGEGGEIDKGKYGEENGHQ